MDIQLKVATLNCWAIKVPLFGSKDREKRIKAIADYLHDSDYDIVAFQELWAESDYNYILDVVKKIFPFTHYFHNGYTGSGTCIFSRHRIISTFKHCYSLNGFAHHIHRGDWFGGKLIGMAEIQVGSIKIALYTTHLHAEYDRKNDTYLPHRIIQAYEVGQFVRYSSRGADVAIVTGDFNIEPDDLAYKLIMDIADLKDSWIEKPNYVEDSGMTCDRHDNCYTHSSLIKENPKGKRLDYIFFKECVGNISLISCENCFDKIPGTNTNYSDHLGVVSHFSIKEAVRQIPENTALTLDYDMMNEALHILDKGQRRAMNDRKIFSLSSFFLIIILIISLWFDNIFGFRIIMDVLRFITAIVFAFFVWHTLVILRIELKGLKESRATFKELMHKSPESINDNLSGELSA
ncbi:Sphingomyelin phosphodiesterase 2 [Strongyloides ratti]|uniref:sphingomyelin phosphodiesterase n=1 Tax=Strongyloides ratti TaxID=34506 RepID=A0A090L1P0_STRRB|nr:Sphingomyelin phosphodiesterase 2 [Strongyloides ratti]CEF63617.1 Sphingomyelin phosphodiesterase 2 [Strongyloides ratti]